MSTQKLINQSIRKLTRLGGRSLAVTIPVELIAKLGWREKQKVRVLLKGRHLIIKDWRKSAKAADSGGKK